MMRVLLFPLIGENRRCWILTPKPERRFRNIVARIAGEEIPFMSMDFDLGLVDKIRRFMKK